MNQTIELPPKASATATSHLDQLKKFTKVVADTGDFGTLKEFAPQDATTNPTLILKAAQMPEYAYVVEKAITDGRKSSLAGKALVEDIFNRLLVGFGLEILKIIPNSEKQNLEFRPALIHFATHPSQVRPSRNSMRPEETEEVTNEKGVGKSERKRGVARAKASCKECVVSTSLHGHNIQFRIIASFR